MSENFIESVWLVWGEVKGFTRSSFGPGTGTHFEDIASPAHAGWVKR